MRGSRLATGGSDARASRGGQDGTRLASSLTTGLKPLPRFRLKAGLRHVGIGDSRKARVPA